MLCFQLLRRAVAYFSAARPAISKNPPLPRQYRGTPRGKNCVLESEGISGLDFALSRMTEKDRTYRSSQPHGERPVAAQPRRCRALRRRSPDRPICRPSSSCLQNLRASTMEDFSAGDRHLRFLRSTDISRFPERLVCRTRSVAVIGFSMTRRWRKMASSHRSP